jgi:hypothetical protein
MCIHKNGTIQKEGKYSGVVYNRNAKAYDYMESMTVSTCQDNNGKQSIHITTTSNLFAGTYVTDTKIISLDDAIQLRLHLDNAIKTIQENNVKKLRESCSVICPVDGGVCCGPVFEE